MQRYLFRPLNLRKAEWATDQPRNGPHGMKELHLIGRAAHRTQKGKVLWEYACADEPYRCLVYGNGILDINSNDIRSPAGA